MQQSPSSTVVHISLLWCGVWVLGSVSLQPHPNSPPPTPLWMMTMTSTKILIIKVARAVAKCVMTTNY